MNELEELWGNVFKTDGEVISEVRKKITYDDLLRLAKEFDSYLSKPMTLFEWAIEVRQIEWLDKDQGFIDYARRAAYFPMDGSIFKVVFSQWPDDRLICHAMHYAKEIVELKLRQIYSKHGI